jgi:hypothetical protein
MEPWTSLPYTQETITDFRSEPNESSSHPHIHLFMIHLNNIFIYVYVSQMVSSLQMFRRKF